MLLGILVSSCSPEVPNIEFCVPLDASTGHCFMTISNEERELSGQAWEDLKVKSFVIPSSSWAEIKKFMLETCERFNNCPEVQVKIKQIEFN